MLQINRLKLDIQTANKNRYGFDISFKKGLNVIKGENSSGKSTTISCLYFGLGIEELLGGKNIYGIDKSLHSTFSIEEKKFNVFTSSVYIEIENSLGEIVTLHRIAKDGNNNKTYQTIDIIKGKLDFISESENIKTAFLHRKNDSSGEFGFYKWLADFIGINLPTVLNYDNKDTTLYLQAIFPALFIEQVKGWSDFLGSQPNFGIRENKLRTIEFILGLNSLYNEVEKERLEEEKKIISKEWAVVCAKIEHLGLGTGASVHNVEKDPVSDSNLLDKISLKFQNKESGSASLTVSSRLTEINEEVKDIEINPLLASNTNNPQLKEKYYNCSKKIAEYKLHEKDFLNNIESIQNQINTYKKHLNSLNKEIIINKDIKYLKEKRSDINQQEICITCSQTIDMNLTNKNVVIELKSIESNISFLENQQKLLISSINSLEQLLKEKDILKSQFKREIIELENEMKYINEELQDANNTPSRTQIYRKIVLENEAKKLEHIKESFEELRGELNNLSERFFNNRVKMDGTSEKDGYDLDKLKAFEKTFKELLTKFLYSSNGLDTIRIQTGLPFKYFPVVRVADTYQKIQISSSASDFVRSNWAYTISLLLHSENKLGILLMDEPGQHAMKSSSLKVLFKQLAGFNDYQIIVAASTEPKEKKKTEDEIAYTLDEVLEGIIYNPIRIEGKIIKRIL